MPIHIIPPANLFYDSEFLDVVAKLIVRFEVGKEQLDYLRDLVHTTHTLLRVLGKRGKDDEKLYIKKKTRVGAKKAAGSCEPMRMYVCVIYLCC